MPFIVKDRNGNILKDQSGNVLGLNRLDGGFEFNGAGTADDQIAKAMNGYLEPQVSRPFHIAFWMYVPAVNTSKELLAIIKTAAGAGQGGGLRITFGSNFSMGVIHGQDAVNNRIVRTFNNAYQIGWNYMEITKATTNTAASYKMYRDFNEITDVSDAPGVSITSLIDFTQIPNFVIGANPSVAGRTPDVYLKDFKFLRRSLDATERARYFYSDGHYVNETSKIVTKTGTVSATTGSNAITGTGTSFTTECTVGEALFSSAGAFLGNISTINSNTSITLGNNSASTYSGAFKHGSLVLDLRLNEKGGTSVADSSGLANTFTKSGSSNTTQGNAGNAWRNSITLAPW